MQTLIERTFVVHLASPPPRRSRGRVRVREAIAARTRTPCRVPFRPPCPLEGGVGGNRNVSLEERELPLEGLELGSRA